MEQVFGPLQSKLKEGLRLIPLEVDVSCSIPRLSSPRSPPAADTLLLKVVGNKAYVEFRGEATQLNGKPYNNQYLWVMIFDDQGHAQEIREYLDTRLVQEVFTNN